MVIAMENFQRYLCKACGLIYDEADGDPDSGLAPGTRFADIPDEWMSPICGLGKADFELCVLRDRTAVRSLQSGAANRVRASTFKRHAKPIVVAGAGAAGWAVAQALRDSGFDGELTMVTGCSGDRYHKPQLSIACASQKSPATLILESGNAGAARLNMRLLDQTWISGMNTALHSLRTTRGSVEYSQLISATGATPNELPAAWAKHCWQINHLHEYTRLRAKLDAKASPQRIVMIGAGLVGIELADDLASQGHTVTIIEAAAQPLARLMEAAQAKKLEQTLAKEGITMLLNTVVQGIQENAEHVSGELLNSSSAAFELTLSRERFETTTEKVVNTNAVKTPSQLLVLTADLILAATGLRTDARLAKSCGIAFNNGYCVNPERMITNAPGVYALGDCA